jgi:hypothetical protein
MTRPMTKRSLPDALVSSTVGTTLISVAAVWLVTSLAYAPVVAVPDTASVHSKSYKPSDRPLYRLSPIPAGADWSRS